MISVCIIKTNSPILYIKIYALTGVLIVIDTMAFVLDFDLRDEIEKLVFYFLLKLKVIVRGGLFQFF